MDNWNNILDENILKTNVNFAAVFVLNYECLKDFIVSRLKEFYCNHIEIRNDDFYFKEDEDYKNEVRALDGNIENASLRWFINAGAITETDYTLYQELRTRRNDIIHEFYKNLNNGFTKEDIRLFGGLVEIYQKLDKWWINETDIPTSESVVPEGYDPERAFGGQAMVLSIINNIVFDNNTELYKSILDELKKYNIDTMPKEK